MMAVINDLGKMDALEIEDDLIDEVRKAGPSGLGLKAASEIMDVPYDQFYRAAHWLDWVGRIEIVPSAEGNRKVIILPGWEKPVCLSLTDRQARVLRCLIKNMSADNTIRIGHRKLSDLAKVNGGSTYDIIGRLDYKGYLEIIDRGGPNFGSLYKIYPNRDGPVGYSSFDSSRSNWAKYNHLTKKFEKEQENADAI